MSDYGEADIWEELAAKGLQRDRYGRPMVVPPGKDKATAYTRCTTYVGVLEDTYNLARWQQRMVAIGLSRRPDLVLAAHAHHDDKEELNKVVAAALDAAAAGAAAGIGTALHRITERMDRGEDPGPAPDGYAADLEAYRVAMLPFTVRAVETFVVNDRLKVGGTPDLIVEYGGKRYIADKKTGSLDWGQGKIAMQLAMYSRSQAYDWATQERTDLEVDQEWGIIIHLPAGQGVAEVLWIDLAKGWEAVQLATKVRAFRSVKKWTRPFEPAALVADVFATATKVGPDVGELAEDALEVDLEVRATLTMPPHPVSQRPPGATLEVLDFADAVDSEPEPDATGWYAGLAAIASCTTVEALQDVYRQNTARWTDVHTTAAALRKAVLTGNVDQRGRHRPVPEVDVAKVAPELWLTTQIAAATDRGVLEALYLQHKAVWTEAHTAAAKARTAHLERERRRAIADDVLASLA